MPRKLMKFLILFDNTNLLFFPGQFLSGRVLLELQEDTPALGEMNEMTNEREMTFNDISVNENESYCHIDYNRR